MTPSSDSRTVAKAAVVNLLGMAARSSRSLVTLFVTRVGGAGTFGLFTLATAVPEVVSRLSILGMDKSLLKFIPETGREPGKGAVHGADSGVSDGPASVYPILSAAFRTALILGVVATALVVWQAPWISEHWLKTPEAGVPVRLAALAILPLTFVFLFMAATKALKIMRYDALVMGIVLPLSLLLFSVPILWTENDTLTMALAYTAAAVAALAASLWFFSRHFSIPRSFLTAPREALGRMVSFSTPLGLHDFVQFLGMKLELFVLTFFMSPVSLGIYALAAELSFVIKKFRQIFDPILIPLMAEAHSLDQKTRLKENMARVIRWILTLGIFYLGGMVLFARPILGLFGEEFVVGGTVVMLLCLAQITNAATGLLDMAMMVSGRPRINLLNMCILLVTQTSLNVWLIPRYGMMGAGVAALVAFALVGVLRLGQGFLILGLNPFDGTQLKPVMAGIAAALAVAGGRALIPLTEVPLLWIGWVGVFGLSYVLVLRTLGFEEEDAELWARIRKKKTA